MARSGDGFRHEYITAHPKPVAGGWPLGQAAILPESDGTDKNDKEDNA